MVYKKITKYLLNYFHKLAMIEISKKKAVSLAYPGRKTSRFS
ncbi:hypothetical protein CLOLEP_00511 [[Clostridium] leptum DSM 753]|uniref:Uncharacterized protein n=1 Tax=[Clostridium] leptum DSM 753 TaxID=428125 RepID=A7VPN5_9FIRM|nr:hypothetical protein CLOLEP_00511 [[Clostridium] leptum DSM 753]